MDTSPTPLCLVMEKYGSDKGGSKLTNHNYTTYYYNLFKDMQDAPLRIFELGIGTNNEDVPSNMGKDGKVGASLYGWAEFFRKSSIFGADVDKRILFSTDRIQTYYCDQTNPDIIKAMWNDPKLLESFDVIIEDGLHTFLANVCFFENSIHKLKPNGYYIIEDIVTYEIPLFEEKIKAWETDYPHLSFKLVTIPHERNNISTYGNTSNNTILVIH